MDHVVVAVPAAIAQRLKCMNGWAGRLTEKGTRAQHRLRARLSEVVFTAQNPW
ncbi:hypothetical protein RIEGSTA812A_PEG_206 [invertebrate metagenome]|uniref:Uncharacterized protein n=1 Tax=invertebrate metagenome TaxID=1711999 RepID=A0A484H7S6_9ZZZZ